MKPKLITTEIKYALKRGLRVGGMYHSEGFAKTGIYECGNCNYDGEVLEPISPDCTCVNDLPVTEPCGIETRAVKCPICKGTKHYIGKHLSPVEAGMTRLFYTLQEQNKQ